MTPPPTSTISLGVVLSDDAGTTLANVGFGAAGARLIHRYAVDTDTPISSATALIGLPDVRTNSISFARFLAVCRFAMSTLLPAPQRHGYMGSVDRVQRDHHRCQAPGCRHTLDIDVHHIKPRAEGGPHDPANLITLCSAHHRAIHAGRLHLTGTAPQALHISHADGTPYGASANTTDAHLADLSEKVFRGLRWLGFKETEAKRALARALDEHRHATQPSTADTLLKRALTLLAPPGSTPA